MEKLLIYIYENYSREIGFVLTSIYNQSLIHMKIIQENKRVDLVLVLFNFPLFEVNSF